jgi:hypothetical protein
MFVFLGSFIGMLDMFFPEFFMPMVAFGLRFMGICLIWTGVILYVGRSKSTGGELFTKLPNPTKVIVLHERRGGSARIRQGIMDILEHIRVKDMLFKDVGGGFRIAGHRVVLTKETVPHNIPEPIAQYIYQIRNKYKVENLEQLNILYGKLKSLKKTDIIPLDKQLEMIPELAPVMNNPVGRQQLLEMDIKDLQQMAELLYDGQVMHMEDYERFQEAAAPYDLESYTKRREVHRILQMIHYKDVNAPDWMKYIVIMFVVLIMGAIAYQIFGH